MCSLLVAAFTTSCGGDGDEGVGSLEGSARSLAASVETKPVRRGGDADDAAIWHHPEDPAKSAVIGTDKVHGILVYDLAGRELQFRRDGALNNVDLRDGFRLGGARVTLVVAADTTTHRLAIYRVDPSTRRLVDVAARDIQVGVAAYGSCMYRSARDGAFYVFVNSEAEGGRPGGGVEQWRLFERDDGAVDARRVRRFSVGSQTEGCVADDMLGHLYVGEEKKGIWRYGAEPAAGGSRARVDTTGAGGHLTAEVEGLTIVSGSGRSGYLIASSQGNNTFVVYGRQPPNEYVKTFRIRGSEGVDAVEETDGIAATSADLGPGFRGGLLVAHDGKDDSGRTNFKLVPLGD